MMPLSQIIPPRPILILVTIYDWRKAAAALEVQLQTVNEN